MRITGNHLPLYVWWHKFLHHPRQMESCNMRGAYLHDVSYGFDRHLEVHSMFTSWGRQCRNNCNVNSSQRGTIPLFISTTDINETDTFRRTSAWYAQIPRHKTACKAFHTNELIGKCRMQSLSNTISPLIWYSKQIIYTAIQLYGIMCHTVALTVADCRHCIKRSDLRHVHCRTWLVVIENAQKHISCSAFYHIGSSITISSANTLLRRHYERDGVLNHQPHAGLLNRLFRRRSKKTSKVRFIGFCEGNSRVTGKFTAQRAINAENACIWWRHHEVESSWYVSTYLSNR